MSDRSEYAKRIEDESHNLKLITNSTMICRDCVNRFDDTENLKNTNYCVAYLEGKPDSIFVKDKCDFYKKE